jgi:hypothetical protein
MRIDAGGHAYTPAPLANEAKLFGKFELEGNYLISFLATIWLPPRAEVREDLRSCSNHHGYSSGAEEFQQVAKTRPQ